MSSSFIQYGKQNITQDDIDAVINVLKSDFLTQGPVILDFERDFAKYIGCKYAVSVANGTAALHLATMALGLNKGDKVITTPITFAASANCIRYNGGDVFFSDIDPKTYLIDLNKVEDLLLNHPVGTFKGIIPVDFAGRAVDLEKLKEIANKYNLWIIEDACHSPGGFFNDSKGIQQNCGNGAFADMAIFSFHPVKHIATGEGGMITTNDEKLFNKLLELRTHGITKNPDKFINNLDFANGKMGELTYPGWYMEMQELGYNYRLTDIQAALGISQLRRANSGLERRRQIAQIYTDAFKDKKYILGFSGYSNEHAYHLYIIEVQNRRELFDYLKQKKINGQVHYIPCHLMPYYRNLGYGEGDFSNAENYYKNCISIPIYPSLTDEQVRYVIDTIDFFYE